MKCQQCGQWAPSGNATCGSCGVALQIQCPSCGGVCNPGHRFCGHCSYNLAAAQEESSAQSAPAPAPAPVSCPHCGQANAPDSAYCLACGRPLDAFVALTPALSPAPVSCLRCRQVNEPDSAYCFACGMPLDAPAPTSVPPFCPRCHQAISPGLDYCLNCGMPFDDAIRFANAPMRLGALTQGAPGGFWLRLAAYLVDNITVTVLVVLIVFASGSLDLPEVAVYLPGPIYHTVLIGVWATTLGKRCLNLYVVRTDGSKVGILRALARHLASGLSLAIFGVGYLMIAFRRDKRGLHDLICDTIVIQRYH